MYHRDFVKIVAMRAHCTLPWERLFHDNMVLGATIADGDESIGDTRPSMRDEMVVIEQASGCDQPDQGKVDAEMADVPDSVMSKGYEDGARAVVLNPL